MHSNPMGFIWHMKGHHVADKWHSVGIQMWRAGLPALGREAPLKPATASYQADRGGRFYGCFTRASPLATTSIEHEQRIIAELRFKAIGRHRSAEQVALHLVAPVFAQEVELFVGFH